METEQIDITPNPMAYRAMLREIILHAETSGNRAWALAELEALYSANPDLLREVAKTRRVTIAVTRI